MGKYTFSWANGKQTVNGRNYRQAVRNITRRTIEVGLLVGVKHHKDGKWRYWSGEEFMKELLRDKRGIFA